MGKDGFTIKLKDPRALEKIFKKFRQDFIKGVSRELIRGALLVRNDAVNILNSGTRTGVLYTRRGVTHRASRSGEPPKSDTGRLANSISFTQKAKVSAFQIMTTTTAGNATVNYADKLENDLNRPFMSTAFNNNERKIIANVRKAVNIIASKV